MPYITIITHAYMIITYAYTIITIKCVVIDKGVRTLGHSRKGKIGILPAGAKTEKGG